MKKIINAKLLNGTSTEILINNNKIVKIANKINEDCAIIDAKGCFVISGLVNCYFDGGLKDVDNLLPQGTTSVFDFSFDENVTEKLLNNGIKVFKAIGDNNGEVLLKKKDLMKSVNKYKENGVKDVILFAKNPNLSEESNYEELISTAKESGCILATSVSEKLEDVGEIDKTYSLSPIGLLESYGFLDQKHLLIDCIYADKEDVNILINYDTNICTCPTKNLSSASGVAPVYSFLKNNLNVVVGGTTTNHFKELSLVKDLQAGTLNEQDLISDNDCELMSTYNAHKIYDEIGVLKEGELADLVLVNDNDFLNLTPLNVLMVLIDGDVKYKRI